MTETRIHRLANGVTVVCDPMEGLESFALSVVAGQGARLEPPDRSGWSHLLEHMVFKGAAGRSARDIVEAIEREGGMINAATGYERTSFQVRALKGRLRLGMEVLADLVLRPTLDEGELEREKEVIAQEIAEAADAPDDHVFELAQDAAFQDQALGRPILGLPEVMRSATPAALEAWRARLYAPDRLVVSAAGAVDEDELLRLAEQCFGAASGPPSPQAQPGRFVGGLRPVARRLEQAHLVFLLPGPGARDDDYFTMRLFAEALGGGMSSRLFQEARERLGLAYAVDAWADAYSDVGVLGIYAGAAAGNAAALSRTAAEQVRALAERIEPDELGRAKAQLKAHMFMAREAPMMRAEQAAGQMLLFGRLFRTSEIAEAVDAVGPDDVARLGGRILGAGSSAAAVLGARSALSAAESFRKVLGG